jgi:DNA-binding CsgD family transcriptional regulator
MVTKRRQSPLRAASSAPPSAVRPTTADAATSGVHRTAEVREPDWTVTKQFVREGYCYRLMRRPIDSLDSGPRFTRREEEALALAADGCSNKRIAQILDVSPSTVGVLLFRAATKLNVKSRDDLLAAYAHWVASLPAAESTSDATNSRSTR